MSEYGEQYDDPGSVAGGGYWEDEDGEEGDYGEDGEEGGYDDDEMDQDLQAALMETMERSDESGSDDGLSGTDDDDDDAGGDDDDEETSERKAKIKQYTSEIKQLETLIDKKRAGFTGGNPIITKRFEETIKGLQDDVNTKVTARQVLLDAIEKEQSDARAAAEAAAPKPEVVVDDGDAGLFEEDGDAEGEMDSNATPAATPGLVGVTPAAAESDDDLFGDDGDESDTGTGVLNTPAPAASTPAILDDEMDIDGGVEEMDALFDDDGEGAGEDDGDEEMLDADDEMDEMAALLQAELGGNEPPPEADAGLSFDADLGAQAEAATAALDEFVRESDAAALTNVPAFGVEGGVGMRRLASGVADDDDSDSADSQDSDD